MDMNFEAIIDSETPVLVDFFAHWCGPCRAMLPILNELESEYGERIRVLKIDVDEHTDLAVRMKVMGVPTFMVFRNGAELWRQPGILTKEALKIVLEHSAS